tara:strand:+ start:877 stop:1104 length:228 start_codon:yes stop_codon:yes gene_type:complete
MSKLHKMIDKLIEIRISTNLPPEAAHDMDFVIETLIDEVSVVPDWNEDITPEEMEDIKYFQSVIRDLMSNRLAMA